MVRISRLGEVVRYDRVAADEVVAQCHGATAI